MANIRRAALRPEAEGWGLRRGGPVDEDILVRHRRHIRLSDGRDIQPQVVDGHFHGLPSHVLVGWRPDLVLELIDLPKDGVVAGVV